VFAQPVTVISDSTVHPEFLYLNVLTDPTSADFSTVTLTSVPATVASSAFGTVWTFKPTEAIPDHQVYNVHFLVSSAVGGNTTIEEEYQPSNNNFDDGFAEGWYKAPARSAIATPPLDNYDGAPGSTVTGTSTNRHVYIEFDEVVKGDYRVLSVHDAQGIDGDPTDIDETFFVGYNSSNDQSLTSDYTMTDNIASGVAASGGHLGNTAGVRFRTRLLDGNGNSLNLHNGATVELQINAVDARGNKFNKILTLTVQ